MIRTPTRASYKVCEFWPKTKITVVEFVVVEVVRTEISKHVKNLSILLKEVLSN